VSQQRIYLAVHGESKRLIRAATPAAARNHIARDSIQVSVATQDDIVDMVSAGRAVEETATASAQKELGE
jgi:hypothetical protein